MTAREWLESYGLHVGTSEKQQTAICMAINAAIAAEREACDVDCAERLGAERLAMRVECDSLRADESLRQLCEQLRMVGTTIAMVGGGTFENDPPDAIIDALQRSRLEYARQLEALLSERNALRARNAKLEHLVALITVFFDEVPESRLVGYRVYRFVRDLLHDLNSTM